MSLPVPRLPPVAGAVPGARHGLLKTRYPTQTLEIARNRKVEPPEEEAPKAATEEATPEATTEEAAPKTTTEEKTPEATANESEAETAADEEKS